MDADKKIDASQSGRKSKLSTEENAKLAQCLTSSFGLELSTTILNYKRISNGQQTVCKSTVRNSAKRVFGGRCYNRQTKKTGSKDTTSKWSQAREGIALQLEQQFREDVEGESMIDKRVVRLFEVEYWVGVITDYDAITKFYKVRYEDNDEKELEYPPELFVRQKRQSQQLNEQKI